MFQNIDIFTGHNLKRSTSLVFLMKTPYWKLLRPNDDMLNNIYSIIIKVDNCM